MLNRLFAAVLLACASSAGWAQATYSFDYVYNRGTFVPPNPPVFSSGRIVNDVVITLDSNADGVYTASHMLTFQVGTGDFIIGIIDGLHPLGVPPQVTVLNGQVSDIEFTFPPGAPTVGSVTIRGFDMVVDNVHRNGFGSGSSGILVSSVPEPSTVAMLFSGLVGVVGIARRRRSKAEPLSRLSDRRLPLLGTLSIKE